MVSIYIDLLFFECLVHHLGCEWLIRSIWITWLWRTRCVQIYMNSRWGWLIPIVMIIRPSWLEVEKATIFWISFCVRTQMAVNRVAMAPRHSVRVWIVLFCSMRGWKRINKKTPATTIVLEWSRADTGVGPSIADDSHGYSPNWADLPVAARRGPISGVFRFSFWVIKICWNSHVFELVRNYAIAIINPTSPIRL